MVSTALKIEIEDVVAALARIRQDGSDDPVYLEIRPEFPDNWPM